MLQINFRKFLENMEEKFHSVSADIPMPKAVYALSHLFTSQGAELFAVGGAIRDFLYSQHHGGKFSPKDVDLATEAPPNKVIEILSSPEAQRMGVKTFPKGESFGVISAILNGEEFEIATFREDGQYSDGRHPDSVTFSSPSKDAKRRDLTYNALFYDIHKKEIRDYNLNSNGEGQGLEDIKNLVARPVGNAHDRFQEDKLRIPRLIRFFSRFNPGEIKSHLDQDTIEAIQKFKDLAGVSPERIANEFIGGLQKSSNPINYIKNYEVVGLLPAVFPNMNPNLREIEKIGRSKNIKSVLAWIFRDQDPSFVRNKLNSLKYPNTISDMVYFLLKLFNFDVTKISQLLRQRDLYKQIPNPALQKQIKDSMFEDIQDFARISGKNLNLFLNYQSPIQTKDFLHLSGKALGDAKNAAEIAAYQQSHTK